MIKPATFNSPAELSKFIGNLPAPAGEARLRGTDENVDAQQALTRLKALVGPIFEYRKRLISGQGGLGSHNALNRYVDLIAQSGQELHIAEYETALVDLNTEVTMLLQMGGSDELAEQLRSAKTRVEQFKVMVKTIEGFVSKLQGRMEAIEKRYAKLAEELQSAQVVLKKTANFQACAAVQTALDEIKSTHADTQALIEKMDEYCGLQIAYNSILLGAA